MASANGTVDTTASAPEQMRDFVGFMTFFLGIVQDIKLFSISIFAMVVYEYFITLDLEVELVHSRRNWKKRGWNGPNILFLINRYFIFVVLGISNLTLFWSDPPVEFCSFAIRFNSLSGIIVTLVANGSLIIRQYALWNRNKIVLGILLLLLIGSCVGGIVAGVIGYDKVVSIPKAYPGTPTGCLTSMPQHVWASFVGILFFDVTLFHMTVVQAWRLRKAPGGSDSPIIKHLLASGSMYFVVMFATTIVAFIGSTTFHNRLAFIMTPANSTVSSILPAMTSIMCSRLLLHIRSNLREAKTPHLQTRATADWPSSPITPDFEGRFDQLPWYGVAPLDSPAVCRTDRTGLSRLEIPDSLEKGNITSPESGSHSWEEGTPDSEGSSFTIRASSTSEDSTRESDSISARW